MSNLRIKPVMRLDTIQRHFRIVRILWERGEPGFGGYSAKLSISVRKRLIGFYAAAQHDWMLTILGVRVHYCRSYGGRFA